MNSTTNVLPDNNTVKVKQKKEIRIITEAEIALVKELCKARCLYVLQDTNAGMTSINIKKPNEFMHIGTDIGFPVQYEEI